MAYYEGTTLWGDRVVLYACIDHDAGWAERHPEMARSESRF